MKKILLLFLLMVNISVYAEIHPNKLFHISKSSNRNIVCYEAILKGNALNITDPVHPFWINNEDKKGEETELNLIQKKMAYGYKAIKSTATEAEITLKAYNKRSIKIRQQGGKWRAYIVINGKESLLNEIYVKSKEGNSMIVEYIILKGSLNGASVQEKVVNK